MLRQEAGTWQLQNEARPFQGQHLQAVRFSKIARYTVDIQTGSQIGAGIAIDTHSFSHTVTLISRMAVRQPPVSQSVLDGNGGASLSAQHVAAEKSCIVQ